MLYDYEMIRPRLPYSSKPFNPYEYISESPETQANRGRAGGVEEGVSAAGTGVASAFPIAGMIMGAGKMAYKGIKSTDTPTGDAFANLFGPHHTTFGLVDDNINGKNLSTGRKVGNMFASIASIDPLAGMIISAMRGKEKREEEKRNVRWMDFANSMNTAAGYEPTIFERPKPGAGAYINDAMSVAGGIKGMVDMFKKKPAAGSEENANWNSSYMGGADSTYTPPSDGGIPDDYWKSQGLPYENAPDVGQGGQTLNLKEGGAVTVRGGRRERDDIALVDTTTGEDTGIRVSKGEKIVFSEETLSLLGKALKKKDKSAVFNLVQEQVNKKPNKKGGMVDGGYEGGYSPQQTKAIGYWQRPEDVPVEEVYDSTGGLMNSDIYNLSGNPAEMPFIPAFPAKTVPEDRTTHTGVSPSEEVGDHKVGDNLAYWGPSAAGTAFDLFRMYQGMKGARTEIPKWHRPAEWVRYMDDMRNASTMGLSGPEMANLQNETDRGYLYDVENIYNASNGNAGTVLGNLGRANNQRNENQMRISAMNRAAKLENLNRYGTVLSQDVNLDRMIFGDRYSEAKQKEAAGAKLANDAMMNMKDRGVVDQFYNPQSLHGKTKAAEVKSKEQTQADQKAFMKFIRENPDAWAKFGVGSSAGALDVQKPEDAKTEAGKMYDEYRAGGGKLSYAEFIKTK